MPDIGIYAARFTEELLRQMPGDVNVQLLAIESTLRDRDDPRAALTRLTDLHVPSDDARLQVRKGMLAAEVYRTLGSTDSASAVIDELRRRYRDNPRIQAMLDRMAQRGNRAP